LPFIYTGIDASTTVLAGKLFLNGSGKAVRTDQDRNYSANNGQTHEWSSKQYLDYRIASDSISVGTFDSCSGECAASDVGAFSDSVLTLTINVNPRTSPVYTYRLGVRF
jgi:hypothetical protein